MDNYLASHMGSHLITMTMIATNYFRGHLHQDLQYLEYYQESSMLKVGNPYLGTTSKHRKKKGSTTLISTVQATFKQKDARFRGYRCFLLLFQSESKVSLKMRHCYMKVVRRPPNMLVFTHTALCLWLPLKFI